MTIPQFASTDFLPVLPALILCVGAIVLLLSEAFQTVGSRAHQSVLAVVTALIAGGVASVVAFQPAQEVFLGFGILDPFSSILTVIVCIAAALGALVSAGYLKDRQAERGEYYALVLFAAAGMSLLAMSAELITLFINLEILSVATYALTSYLRRGGKHAEAGFKYFILGAFSSAVLLYGTALLYGATGSTKLTAIGAALRSAESSAPGLVYLGLAFVAAGFAFKVAAVPFHMWTPDVYEGAPTPVTAIMSAGVKAAAFAAMIRVFIAWVPNINPELPVLLFSTFAVASMVIGNLLAIPQRNVKRMLAYSSIAHAGYLLLGVAALFVPSGDTLNASSGNNTALLLRPETAETLKGIMFYLFGYTVTAIGAFGILAALERRADEERGTSWDLERLSGLVHRRPAWAVAMAIFMLSLGGIPPSIGFFGKLFLFKSAVNAGLVWLAVVGILSSAAGVYFYLRVVVYMFMRPATDAGITTERHWGMEVALAVCALAVVGFGLMPGGLATFLSQAGTMFGAGLR